MKRRVLAILSALTLLSGCATLPAACNIAITAGTTAQDLIPILVRDWGLSEDKAAAWASVLLVGRDGVERFCGAVT